MEVDSAMAARFLAALSDDAEYTFQTFDDDEERKARREPHRSLARKLHGTFHARLALLTQLNGKGAGVFVMVNRGDGFGRAAANVTAARALFVDLDGSPVEPLLGCALPPRIVVESSPGRWHGYWPIVDLPLERFTDAQKALAARFDGDSKVHDRPRVMRLPGFLHRKGEPFVSRLVKCDPSPLTWREMAQAFDLGERFTLPEAIPEGCRNAELFKLAASAARKGVPEAEQLKKAQKVNADRCRPPLSAAEVAQIVASAYRRPVQGVAAIPLAVVDSEAYRAISDGARTLLLLAYRKRDSYTELLPLTWTECRPWMPRKNTFQRLRAELVSAGLLAPVIAAEPAQPHRGKGPKPTFYRLAIGAKSAPYSTAPIGAKSAPPEALQAVAAEALKAPDSLGGPFSAAANDSEAAA